MERSVGIMEKGLDSRCRQSCEHPRELYDQWHSVGRGVTALCARRAPAATPAPLSVAAQKQHHGYTGASRSLGQHEATGQGLMVDLGSPQL